ncbi:MAG TPA: helix-turn-helix domain containing protein [Halomicronema sp.]
MESQAKEKQIQELDDWINNCSDDRQLKRAVAVKLYLQGRTYRSIAEALNVSPRSISNWKKRYESKGISELKFSGQGAASYSPSQPRQEVIEWLKSQAHWDLSKIELASADIETLQKFYTFKEPAEIIKFLQKNPFLIPLILEAHPHIRKHFPESRLYLQVRIDPEIPSWKMLRLSIDTNISDPEIAIDTLEKIDDEWWLDAQPRSQNKMFLNLN